MVTRWRALFGSALFALCGVAWLARSLDMSLATWISAQLLGMIAACGFAFGGVVTGTRKRWPAAAALVCASPMGQVLSHFSMLPGLIRMVGVPGVVWIVGCLATIAVAIVILVLPPPPIPFDPIPPARTT